MVESSAATLLPSEADRETLTNENGRSEPGGRAEPFEPPSRRRRGRDSAPAAEPTASGPPTSAGPGAATSDPTKPPLKKILMALRGASPRDSHLPMAELFVKTFNAELVLLSILPADAAIRDDRVSPQQAQATAYLETMSARLHAQGQHAHGLLRFASSPADTIIAEANESGADLIIMGVGTAGGLTRAFQPNVSDAVARRAPCPVMLIQQGPTPKREPAVRSFDADSAAWGPLARWNLGVRPVDISRIVGSVGRAGEVIGQATLGGRSDAPADRRYRYQRVLTAMRSGIALPAVELYKLGSGYYVLDGNHRVAAARELGQTEIDADVTEFVPIDDLAAQKVFAERRAFERLTGLTDIESAHVPGTYPSLAKSYNAFAGESSNILPADVARRWYNQFYVPLARMVRERDLTRHYPGEQVADLVVRLASYRHHITRREGKLLEWPDLVAQYVEKKIPRDRKAVLGHSFGGRRSGGGRGGGSAEAHTGAKSPPEAVGKA